MFPQVAPLWTSFALYRFESNARSATVLSLIGAGGIGQVLFDSINSFAFAQTSAIVIVIIVAVSGIDLLSQLIRGGWFKVHGKCELIGLTKFRSGEPRPAL